MLRWQDRITERIARGEKPTLADRLLTKRRRFTAEIEQLADLLCYNKAPVNPPLALKQRVLATLEQDENRGKVFVPTEEQRWRALLPGIEVCLLNRSKTHRTVLLRIKAGYTLPAHPHVRTEHAMLLEGSCFSGRLRLKSGDFLLSERGTLHEPVRALEDCTILIVAHR